MIVIIPSAQMLDYEMQSETGACTHALISLAGKPLFVHIVECYQKIIDEENLTVILIVKKGVKKLIGSYIEYVDKCIEIGDSKNLLETINAGLEEGISNHTSNHDDQVVVHMADTLLLGKELTLQSDYIYASRGIDGYRWTLFNELNGLIKVDFDRILSTLNNNEQLLFIGIFRFHHCII